jgi:tetratricopeptide (TPR) repeat protein
MLNYGIAPDGYRRDLHEILYKTYAGLAASESLTARYGLPDVALGLARRIEYRFKSRVHKLLYQKYALLSAGAFETDGGGLPAVQTAQAGDSERHLDALAEYFNAFYDYRGRAIDYLRAAEDFELALIPEAAGHYLFEAGKLLKDEALLNEALAALDPVWEKDLAADAYTEVALLAKKKRQNAVARDAAGRLFALNPGALRQNGIRLPVNVELDAAGGLAARRAKALLKTLNRAGFDTNPAGGQNVAGSRWTLRLRFDGGETEAELSDGGTGITKRLKAPPLQSFSAKHRAAFANALAGEVF